MRDEWACFKTIHLTLDSHLCTFFRQNLIHHLRMKIIVPPHQKTFIHSHGCAPRTASLFWLPSISIASSVRTRTPEQICRTFPFVSHTYLQVYAVGHIWYLPLLGCVYLTHCPTLSRICTLQISPVTYVCVGVWIVIGSVGEWRWISWWMLRRLHNKCKGEGRSHTEEQRRQRPDQGCIPAEGRGPGLPVTMKRMMIQGHTLANNLHKAGSLRNLPRLSSMAVPRFTLVLMF